MALMARTVFAPGRVLILAALAGVVPGFGSDQSIQAQVERAATTPYRTDDPDVAGFKLTLDIRLTNRSGGPLDLPKAGTVSDGTTRIAVLGLEAKRPDGSWSHVVQSSWYDTGTIKYESCGSLPPGGTVEFSDSPSGLVLLKKQLAGLGSDPTVRFSLMVFCRQPDGKVVTKTVTTDGVDLRLPARP
jgi:hypothetical protein